LSVANALASGKKIHSIYSFETIPFLREEFTAWIYNQTGSLSAVYDAIADKAAEHFNVESKNIRKQLQSMAETKNFMLHESVEHAFELDVKLNVIFYDMYSNKMNQKYWSEEFLTELFRKCCASNCVIATYAATGALSRSLKNNGFVLEKKSGFSGKRHSTLALRN
jgi:tRNA U34 5-methylaminomethyl-2-thiouridine-forming methyltransferase MnmC